MQKIGVIGLGNMGLPMAQRLLQSGYQVVGYDVRRDRLERLVAFGATVASSPGDVGKQVSIVILSLPNSPATEEVVLGDNGLLNSVSSGSLVIDMGSSVPSSTRKLGALLAQRGAHMLDAPVSGGPRGAETGTLAIIIGGAPDHIARAMPLFRVLGAQEKITIVGPLGSGHFLKAINNYIYACSLWVSSEAFVVAAKAGLDMRTVQKVLATSSGRNRAVEDNIPNQVLDRSFPPSFALGLLNKDLNTFLAVAKELDVPIPLGGLLKELYNVGLHELGGDVGDSKIITLLEKWAGVEVRG